MASELSQDWTARVEFEGASPDDIRTVCNVIQEVMVENERGRIKKVTLEDSSKRNKGAFDRSHAILLAMHKDMSLPHPMSWNTVTRQPAEDGSGVWEVMESAIAVTTDPDDARLLTALTQIVWPKTNARQRLSELVAAYITGDDPGAVIRGLGASPEPGLDVGVVQNWFNEYIGGRN